VQNFFAFLLLAATALADEPQIHRDIPYAEPRNERQTLDVYAPREGKNHPIVFWIHGGGWQAGDKTDVQVKPQVACSPFVGPVIMGVTCSLIQ
jgi:acetyl esterase/lipase